MGTKGSYRLYCIGVLSLTLVPWAALCLFNYVVDPFDMNRVFHLRLTKQGPEADERMFKLVEYMHQPREKILLGDSRMNNLRVRRINRVSGLEYYNFAYGGGTAYEIIDTFWYAAGRCRLKEVCVGMGFNLWNSFNDANRVADARGRIDHKDRYYSSFFTAQLSYKAILTTRRTDAQATTVKESVAQAVTKQGAEQPRSEAETGPARHQGIRPSMTRDEFWEYQLNTTTDMFYSRYRYPDDIVESFRKIKQYCDDKGIRLLFVIVPTHIDLQQRVEDYNLGEQYGRFKKALAAIAPTIDYDYPNEWTRERRLFDDPYHSIDAIGNAIVDEVWGDNVRVGRR